MVCKSDNCTKTNIRARGYCAVCYNRRQRHGEFKDSWYHHYCPKRDKYNPPDPPYADPPTSHYKQRDGWGNLWGKHGNGEEFHWASRETRRRYYFACDVLGEEYCRHKLANSFYYSPGRKKTMPYSITRLYHEAKEKESQKVV